MKTAELGPCDIAALRLGMWAVASEPTWSLAMKVLDRAEERACSTMSGPEAQAWMAIVMAPAALKAAHSRAEIMKTHLDMVREDRTRLTEENRQLRAEVAQLQAVLLGRAG